MPLYDYWCEACEVSKEEFINRTDLDTTVIVCECGLQMKRLMPGSHRFTFKTGHFFEPYVDTDIHPEGKPIKIATQDQFFRECQKHGRGYRAVRDKLR